MKKSSIFVALIMMSFACASTLAQHCKLHFQMRNKSRHIWGAPWNAECRGSIHSAPFGNFGVSSNVGRKRNSSQFPGWKPSNGQHHWNACEKDFPPADCRYYNAKGCQEQSSRAPNSGQYGNYGGGWMNVSVGCPTDWNGDGWPDYGGCLDANGASFTVSGNFMSIYELDPWDADEFVRTTYHANRSVRLNCPSWDYCGYSISDYVAPYRWEDEWGNIYGKSAARERKLINTSVAVEVVEAWFEDPYTMCGRPY